MNLATFLEIQKSEDRQAIIIHAPAMSGKTIFVKQLTNLHEEIHYIDFLKAYLENPHPLIHLMGFTAFRDYLLSLSIPKDCSAVIVDQLDFLFNTWDKSEKEKFVQWLKFNLRSPAVVQQTFIFVLQTDDIITSSEMNNSLQQSRIINLNNLENLYKPGRK